MSSRTERVIAHPLHVFLGVAEVRSEGGRSHFSVPVAGPALNPAGVLHGGVVYTLCDVAAYLALLSVLDPQLEAVTHDIHVSVLRPAFEGEILDLRGEVIRRGRSIAFLDAGAWVGDRQIARATVTKSLLVASA